VRLGPRHGKIHSKRWNLGQCEYQLDFPPREPGGEHTISTYIIEREIQPVDDDDGKHGGGHPPGSCLKDTTQRHYGLYSVRIQKRAVPGAAGVRISAALLVPNEAGELGFRPAAVIRNGGDGRWEAPSKAGRRWTKGIGGGHYSISRGLDIPEMDDPELRRLLLEAKAAEEERQRQVAEEAERLAVPEPELQPEAPAADAPADTSVDAMLRAILGGQRKLEARLAELESKS